MIHTGKSGSGFMSFVSQKPLVMNGVFWRFALYIMGRAVCREQQIDDSSNEVMLVEKRERDV